jgi:glycerol-3-phosphate dehydrogenase
VVTITGGKLTTYRVMAAEVTDLVEQQLGKGATARGRAPTRNAALPGGDIGSLDRTEKEAGDATGDASVGRHLARAYGSRWPAVWAEMKAHPMGQKRVVAALPYTFGELRHAVRSEMACTLADLFVRRTHLAFETRDHGMSAAAQAAHAVGDLLAWDADGERRAVDELQRDVERIFGIDPDAPTSAGIESRGP